MKAVIMAGGLGMRLRPLTTVIPKPLLPLGEKSILEIQIDKLKSYGFTEVIIATNYKSQLFEAYFRDANMGIKVSITKEDKPLGTAGPLKLLEGELTEPFLVINGDILTNLDFTALREFHVSKKSELTIVSKRMQTPLQYGVVESRGDRVLDLKEKPNIISEILAGIYYVNPSVLDSIPPGTSIGMPELIKTLIKQKRPVFKYILKDYWLDIGLMENYEQAQQDLQSGILHYDK